MSWKELAGKGTWLGLATAAAALLALLGAASLLLVRGVLPEGGMAPAVYGSAALACFCGGRVAVRQGDGGALLRALAVSGCVYGGLWLAALSSDAPVAFGANGMYLTAAVWGGGLLAGAAGRRKRRRRAAPRARRPADRRRKRAVT